MSRPPAPVLRLSNCLGGAWVPSRSPRVLTRRDPVSGEPLAAFGDTTREETRQAIAAARDAFPGWRETPPAERARLLIRLKVLLEENRESLARVLTREHGKLLRESRLEIDRAIGNVEVAAGAPNLLMGQVLEDAARGIDEYSIRRPLGVTAAICPFNFPAMIPFWFLPYALACGNTMIVKASPLVPETPVEIFRLLDRAGFPPGVANLILGDREAADELLENPTVRSISFVGSTEVGREVYRRAAANGKRVQVQAGAKNFGIVMPDACMEKTIPNLISSSMDCSGQRCLALAAVIAVGDAYGAVREGLLAGVSGLRQGPGWEEGVDLGPVITPEARDRICARIGEAAAAGAEILADGRGAAVDGYPRGNWVGPTVIEGCTPDMPVIREEIFGPVVCLLRAPDLGAALEIIRGSRFGNAASIFTSSGAAARRFRYEAPCGNLGINIGVAAPMPFFPFGGTRESFFGDQHAQGAQAFSFYTDAAVCVERWF